VIKERALKNKTIVITRPLESAKSLKARIESEGGSVILFPTIKIIPTENWGACDLAIKNMESFDWIVFSSQNSVKYFLQRLSLHNKKIGNQKIGVIGAKTAEFVSSYDLPLDLLPEKYSAAGFLEQLRQLNLQNKNFLLPVSDIARDELICGLRDLGHRATSVEVYRTVINNEIQKEELQKKIGTHGIDCLTFFSPSAFTSFLEIMNKETLALIQYNNIALAAIGETTAAVIQEKGFYPHIIAQKSSDNHILEAIKVYFSQLKDGQHVLVS
jgi:uroporphyrinogen-III synthase